MESSWSNKDFYKILELDSSATGEEIKKSYRKLARELHPDKNPESGDRFKEVAEAYAVLSDPKKKQEYDMLKSGGGFSMPGGFFHQKVYDFVPGDSAYLKDLLSDYVGETKNRVGNPFGFTNSGQRGKDELVTVSVPFDVAAIGGQVTIEKSNGESFDVDLPGSVESGDTFTVRGQGSPSKTGGSTGDLHIKIEIAPHKWFTAAGADLEITVPVTFDELALGGVVEVPTYQSGKVRLRIPSGTQNGKRFRVAGKGLNRPDGSAGNLFVTVSIEIPKTLPPEGVAAVEEYRRATEIHTPRSKFKE